MKASSSSRHSRFRVLLSVGEHVVLLPKALLQLARPLIDAQVRGERFLELVENRVSTGDPRCLEARIEELVEQVIPEIHLPVPAKQKVKGDVLLF